MSKNIILSKVFANNLARRMGERGIDRNMLCDDLDLPYSTVSDWLAAKKYPRIDKIALLADYFNVKLSDLIEDKSLSTNNEDKEYNSEENKKSAPADSDRSRKEIKIRKYVESLDDTELDLLLNLIDAVVKSKREAEQ